MKQVMIEVSERLEKLLTQFLNTDTMATRTPIFIVQSCDRGINSKDRFEVENNYDDIAYFFSKEEAKRYIQYQKHNLNNPRIYCKAPGYNNEGDFEPFYKLLREIAGKL
jgi:hypothetical protein